jgi:pimeloyl-ACP methyl ester carboxylesterase
MWKAGLFGLTAAAAVTLAGCSGGSSSDGESPQTFDSLALFDPVPSVAGKSAIIPFPFNGLFAGFNKPTLNIPNAAGSATFALVDSVNHLDGFSTVADLFADVLGTLDYSTVGPNVLIYDTSTGQPLVFGTDFTVQNSNATALDAGSGQITPISAQRSRILIEPTHALKPGTSYLVALRKGMKNTQGGNIIASDIFKITSSSTPVSQQTAAVLSQYTDAQKATLEALRSTLIQPAVAGISQLSGTAAGDIVLAWSFTTQSLTKTLGVLATSATATTIAAQNTGVTTATAVGIDGATIYAGIVQLPYYLTNAGGSQYSTDPLTKYWLADANQPDVNAKFPIGNVPCGAFATGANVNGQTAVPSESTTVCYPVPVKKSNEIVPMIVAVPNAASGRTMPANGWPVVIFQHGITGNRTQMLAIAPALAKAGFVTVAIDLPLHGLVDTTSPFYRNQLFTGTAAAGLITGERTFDLDLENNATSAQGPDGKIDPSGTYFINLTSLLTSRDNLRQAAADLITLSKSIANLQLSTDGSVKVDPTQLRFAALSLGSIVGIPFLANTTAAGTPVSAATLAVPGGGIGKLLDASKTFGPIVAAGLGAAGVKEGSDDYETFLRFAQTVVDDGDPLNYAAAAAGAHPIHLIEVIGDTVVPNSSQASPATATQDLVTVGSNLGGTNPLIAAMGLTVIGPIDVPGVTPSKTINTSGVRAAVKFNQGSHGSILDPTASQAVTVEMQTETANFLGSNGICLPVGGGC